MSGGNVMTLADPLYEIPLKCPVCYTEPVLSYKLKSKCQTISQDDLTIPSYVGIRGHADADILPMAPTVCPRCLYASTQGESFIRVDPTKRGDDIRLRDDTQEALLLSHVVRQGIIDELGLTVADFQRPRSSKAAYAAYRLTAWTAAIKAEHRVPRSMSELATAHLYSYVFAEQALASTESRECLEKAARAYAQVFQTGDHEPKNVDQLLYLVIALHLRLGWREEAKPFLIAFERLREKVRALGGEDAARMRVYQDRISDLWQMSS
ncbi:MAG: DUF2225 domain-containing protein [Candidatus Sericytochromatia bacterium]|nr:DUF2225 domain-containing protein [Candidatus Sericytochromatia bacterium]